MDKDKIKEYLKLYKKEDITPEEKKTFETLASEFANAYNTELEEGDKEGYEAWVKTLPENFQSSIDYDLKGYYKENKNNPAKLNEVVEAGDDYHMVDKYKKPNHSTFTTESIYSNDEIKGGTYDADGKFVANPEYQIVEDNSIKQPTPEELEAMKSQISTRTIFQPLASQEGLIHKPLSEEQERVFQEYNKDKEKWKPTAGDIEVIKSFISEGRKKEVPVSSETSTGEKSVKDRWFDNLLNNMFRNSYRGNGLSIGEYEASRKRNEINQNQNHNTGDTGGKKSEDTTTPEFNPIQYIVDVLKGNIDENERSIYAAKGLSDALAFTELGHNIQEEGFSPISTQEPNIMIGERFDNKELYKRIDKGKNAAIRALRESGQEHLIPSVLKATNAQMMEADSQLKAMNAQAAMATSQFNTQAMNQGIQLGMQADQFNKQMEMQDEAMKGQAISKNLTKIDASTVGTMNSLIANKDTGLQTLIYATLAQDPELMKKYGSSVSDFYSGKRRGSRKGGNPEKNQHGINVGETATR